MLTSNTFVKGMNQDYLPKFQPDGTVRYALNAVLETVDGSLPSISNELGNYKCATGFPDGKTIVGHTLTDTEDVVLFVYDPDPSTPEHEIGIYDAGDCVYTTVAKGECLNFSDQHPVNAIFRIRNGCERVVYFTDDFNNYRVANISDTTEWVDQVTKAIINCEKILYTRPYSIPSLASISGQKDYVRDGSGQLEYGTYAFYIKYLDADENGIEEWLPLTNYVPVFYGAQDSIESTQTWGASNEISSPYYKPPANKSITLPIANLDTDFKFYQIAVVKRTGESGAISGIDLMYPREITGTTSTFQYTGMNSQVIGEATLEEILIPTQRIEKVRTHEVEEERLLPAGITNTSRDFSTYQRYASKIKVEYVTTNNQERESKVGTTYLTLPDTMFDEIYALGIRFIHTDGTKSPAFHIPGRPADISEIDVNHIHPYISSYTNWDTDDITGDPNIFNNAKTKRWQVYSTATLNDATSTTGIGRGFLGYYETPTTYPDIETCDGSSYWGTDWTGASITPDVTKIRHHRMPAQYMYKDVGGSDYAQYGQYRIQLKFSNIELPNSDVEAYEILYGDRTEEYTIEDKGYLKVLNWDPTDEVIYHSYLDWRALNFGTDWENADQTYSFVSPRTVFESKLSYGDYITIEKWTHTSTESSTDIQPVSGTVDVNEYSATLIANTAILEYKKMVRPDARVNYVVTGTNYLPPAPVIAGGDNSPTESNTTYVPALSGFRVENRQRNYPINILQFDERLDELNNIAAPGTGISAFFNQEHCIVALKHDRDVFTNLYEIQYKKFIPNRQTAVTPSSITVPGGDVHTSYLDMEDIFWDNTPEFYAHFNTAQIQSTINSEGRAFSDIDAGRYTFYRFPQEYNHELYRKYIGSKYYELSAGVAQFFLADYTYFDKYSYLVQDPIYSPIPFNFDMCSDCRESFPYRIYYSEQDFLESKADKWRVIFANNYRDIDGLDGPITDMFKAFDHLYLGTQRGLYRLPTKAQTIQTDNSTAFLGVGDFLSLPFRKLKSPDYAIGGVQSFLSRVNTEFGTFFIDTHSARPLLVTNQLNDLSEGLRNHWQENGDLKLAQQFKSITGVEYPVLEVTSPVGIGHISTFDPRTKRIIVHKKDYTINPDYLTNLVYSPTASITDAETLWFNGSKWYWNKDGSTTQEVSMDNAQYFTPEHFTLSYSFLVKNWVSFHSYFPYYMFNTDKTFFSNDLWEHGKGSHQNFYGMYYPHVVDLIAKQSANEIKYANNIYYLSKVQGYDSNHKNYYDVDMTFDGLIAYNDTQSTGYKDLIKKTPFSTGYNSSAIAVRKVDKKYRISEIRDYVVDSTQPIWSSNSQQLSSTPYLDKVPNTSNISFSKSLFELTRFRDHYLGIRLFFNPKQNYRITTDIVNTAFANRNR